MEQYALHHMPHPLRRPVSINATKFTFVFVISSKIAKKRVNRLLNLTFHDTNAIALDCKFSQFKMAFITENNVFNIVIEFAFLTENCLFKKHLGISWFIVTFYSFPKVTALLALVFQDLLEPLAYRHKIRT